MKLVTSVFAPVLVMCKNTMLRSFMYNWRIYVRFMSKVSEPRIPQSNFINSSSFQKNKFRFTNLKSENNLYHRNPATNLHPQKGHLTNQNLDVSTNMRKSCNKSVSYSLMSEDLVKENNSINIWRDTVDKYQVKGEILYGVHPVSLALKEKKRHIFKLFVKQVNNKEMIHKMSALNQIIELALAVDVPVQKVSKRVLSNLSNRHVHQGVCLDVSKLKMKNEQDVFLNFCRLSPVVSKASAGSLEVLDLYQVNSLPAFLEKMKQEGWNIVGTRGYSKNNNYTENIPLVSVQDFILAKPTVIIIGNEGRGVSYHVHDLCDAFLTVPPGQLLYTDIESLNVSVATGIILHRLLQTQNS
ncbi:rRNA methyltransferase 1, mitochondrial-like isoform X2 [Tachypleus tridentatus]|uniref:rRNA methyltransferase 1, mitochondrial-like isoform X2 n=1 Tax=Tachypleus tridentatus TaxID=6853 RepID=UPI003FD51570